ncbi:MAG: hypothetical protein LBE91_05010, partial [Tannerella sp.]|nr:hypothetical protein [Tannerella sp.]
QYAPNTIRRERKNVLNRDFSKIDRIIKIFCNPVNLVYLEKIVVQDKREKKIFPHCSHRIINSDNGIFRIANPKGRGELTKIDSKLYFSKKSRIFAA